MRLRPLLGSLALAAATLASTALAQSSLVFIPPAGVAAKNKHVVFLSGDEEYRSEESLPMLAKILSQRHGFKCTVLFALDADGTINPDNQKSLPNSEALDTADAIVMLLRFRQWPDEAMARFEAAFKRGVPIVALRTSTHAFNFPAGSKWSAYTYNSKTAPWLGGFGKNVLGETWLTHWGRHKIEATRGALEASAANDPILRGVADVFGNSDVYEAYPPADAKILLRGIVLKGMNATDAPADYRKKRVSDGQEQAVNDPAMAVAWTRSFKNDAGQENKILTTTLGAATDLENEGLRRLVVNGVYWGLGLDVPAKSDVRLVDPYAPTMYGFRGYRYRLTPADYALGKTVRPGEPMPAPPPKQAPGPKKQDGEPKKSVQVERVAPNALSGATNAVAAQRVGDNALHPQSLRLGPALTLNPGEHVAIIGNGFADRMQHAGALETLLHAAHPAHRLVVRNLAFPGDELTTRARSKDFGTPDEWLTRMQADTVFAFFGYNESFAGPAGVEKFKSELAAFIRDTRAKNYSGRGAPRLVLFSPIATEKHPDPNFVFSAEREANLALYTRAMAEVCGDQAGVTFVDLFAPSRALFDDAARNGLAPLTINGVHLNARGDALLAEKIFPVLVEAVKSNSASPTPSLSLNSPALAALREAVNAKNAAWHARYRTVDGYNIYGERSKIAYVSQPDAPKITNTQIMMEEMAQRDVITANLERKLWAAARGDTAAVEELPLPPVTPFGTNKPGPRPDGTYEFLGGEEAIAKMTLAPGLKANLFASEEMFPELAKAVQMAWDTRGRLWVAVWPSYPERTPTSTVADKLLVLEDTDHDGRADKCTTFLDGLNCPTGFQFFKDGVLVVQAPDVWFVRDTDGDGRADWRERVLMGLDSADSHHTANSLIYEPGGAILLSDGVFHRSQVETINGVVRNIDGAVYRFEPLTGKFETYIAYNFANPHGRAFTYWGEDIITDATGNNTYWGPAFSGRLDHPQKHPRLRQLWERPSRPSAGSTILTSTHFPEEYWGDYLNPNVIGFQGVYRVQIVDDGSGTKGTREKDLLSSKDPNFRPIDTSIGPDGALYLVDWHNPLIGHLQSHLRDKNRDHTHGRIYRITAEGRPLVWQPKIADEPIPALLELLKRKENQIRNLAKIELGKHDAAKVIPATKAWLAALDRNDRDYEHHVLEALWVHQWHNVVDADLLARVLQSPEPRARGAALRVLGYWRERVPDALALVQRAATDENSRVRLQAVRTASFFAVPAATEVPLAAAKLPVDYYLDYVIGETLRQLRPLWRKQLGEGATFAGGDPASTRYLLRTLSVAELLKMPRNADVAENIVGRSGVADSVRAEALADLAKARKKAPVALLIDAINSPAETDSRAVGRLLLAQPPAELRAHRAALSKIALTDDEEARSYAWAAVALADGTLDRVFQEASVTPLAQAALLAGIHLLPDAALRATAFERVMAVLAKSAPELPGPDHVVHAMQRDAIRAAVSTKREPAAVFAALRALIERGEQVPTAAQGIRALPRETWPVASAGPTAQALIAWAQKTHTNERSSRDYVETIQVADTLAGLLPAEEAATLRRSLARLRVPVYVVRTVVEGMKFDTPRLVVPANRAFEIIFDNPDVMPHNFVIVQPGAREKVGQAAMLLAPDYVDRSGRAWVPESNDVVAATKTLEQGQSETLRLRPIRDEGVYEFVCTFPGHWMMMYGQLVVTADVDAYLAANPAPARVTSTATPAAHAHSH